MTKHYFDYQYKDILNSLSKLNIKKNDVLYVSANLLNFGRCKVGKLNEIPKLFYNAISEIIGKKGTIVVPSHTFNLINKSQIFDLYKTKSMSGSFSNFILRQKSVVRQLHPYSSSAAIGKYAKDICSKNTEHVYGLKSPFDKMIKKNAKFLSLGLPINLNCSQVHHAEYLMRVPYRFSKEFKHKVKIKSKIYEKLFFMFVLKDKYTNLRYGIGERERNQHKLRNELIIKNFIKNERVYKSKLGNNYVYSYNLKKFFHSNMKLFNKNIYCWVGKSLKTPKIENVNKYYENLISRIGLKKNDVVHISSDLTDLLLNFKKNNEIFDGNKLIDAIIRKIGLKGTILFPCFNWDFCKGKKFEYYKASPRIGSLPKIAFKRKDFKRTKHPIYSFMVWGKDSDFLINLNNKSACGSNSPFSYLYKSKAKQLFIGMDYKKGFTFIHHIEEKLGTKYRYLKTFTAPYVDDQGNEKTKSFIMNVINLKKSNYCRIDPRMDNELIRNGAYSKYLIDNIPFTLIDLKIAGNIIEKEIKSNKSFLVYKKGVPKIVDIIKGYQ